MWIIAIAAAAAAVLLDVVGAIPTSSVGGALTYLLLAFLVMLAAGIHDAWSHGRGVFGWFGSLVVAIVGGLRWRCSGRRTDGGDYSIAGPLRPPCHLAASHALHRIRRHDADRVARRLDGVVAPQPVSLIPSGRGRHRSVHA